jgi:beta-glucosidase
MALAGQVLVVPLASANGGNRAIQITHPSFPRGRCPWIRESRRGQRTPAALARQVVARMTLREKADFVALGRGHGLENFTTAVASLCLPSLTLSDGPDGLAGDVSGVTQLPAAIGIGASFNASLAFATGKLVGEEARAKGINAVQGPDLNLARVPLSGRIFESFGEDPFLTSRMGVASIDGIQSENVMAVVKHFVAYSQETARARINDVVTARALAELYDPPFESAVKLAHVAGVMCASGQLNGVRACADPYIYSTLASWGFRGFVRSDARAAPAATPAFAAGLDLIKPNSPLTIERLVRDGIMPVRYLNRAVRTVLTEMFAYGLIARPRRPSVNTVATTPSHAATALLAAEESVVLLKDDQDVLPLSRHVGSIAVIGTDARDPLSSGGGSSEVIAPFAVSPLSALRSALGSSVRVTYAPGGPVSLNVGALRGASVVRGKSGAEREHGTTTTVAVNADLDIEAASDVTNDIITASAPGRGRGWSHWRAGLRVRRTGTYEISIEQIGDTWLYLDGRALLSSPGLHAPSDMTTVVNLRGGRTYTFKARWFSVIRQSPPELGVLDVTHQLHAAAAVARRAKVAVVFASAPSSEGADQTSFNLPGDENALIEAVAQANPHTIVVLDTGNAVVMPWLNHVKGVLEAWYPGEEDGTAIAKILTGAFDPSGRLPITFPSSAKEQPLTSPNQFPGVDDEANFGTGGAALDIGYRWYQARAVTPLFPFGFGLSYTAFSLREPSIQLDQSNILVHLTVTNTGRRSGADVVQVYVADPPSLGEPPEQLRAFARVALAPSASRLLTLSIPLSSLDVFSNGKLKSVAGTYRVSVGPSSSDLPITEEVRVP